MFSINHFEQYIDETILKRGLSYFKKGYVSEPEEITTGVYQAIVSGSEDYTVELEIKNGQIIEHTCTCPYDMGPVCKHIASVLFYLQKDILTIDPERSPKQKAQPKEKKPSLLKQVDEILETISHNELKQFIREQVKKNPSFRNTFLSSFAHQNTNDSKELYAKQIKSILNKEAGREGFIYWNQTGKIDRATNELLITAKKQLENKNYKSAIHVCCAVMEELTAALQFSDDSNGYIGGNIERAYNLLCTIAGESVPEEIRSLLFEYCLSAFEKQTYDGWDWHLGMLNLASLILKDDEEAQKIITCLDTLHDSKYEIEHAQEIKLTVIRKTKGEEEADKFIEQNLSNPGLRHEAIAKALKNKNYEKAISISKDGIKHDEKSKPGLVKQWYDWLLKIAQAQNDTEKIIEYSRYLFIDNFRNEQDYYQLMKINVQQKKWNEFVEGLIKDISSKKRWLDEALIAKIYIEEKWFERLLKLITEKPTLQKIEEYEKYLSTDYSTELADLYEQSILEYMQINTGRGHYQTACKYLRRMKKLGAREKVDSIINFFKKEYPQRKALMEELQMV